MTQMRLVDRGYHALVKRVFGVGKPRIRVGIFEAEGSRPHDGGLTVLEVAIINEFGGDPGPPARSFIRSWFDQNEERARKMLTALMTSVVEGRRTKEQALELLAQKFVAEIQQMIADGIPPPNAPSTIAAKGSSTPLVNTGQLRTSVTYEVDEG